MRVCNDFLKSKTKSTNLQFNYTRANDSFEDVMSYYHIDTLQRYIQSLGFKNINNRSIKSECKWNDGGQPRFILRQRKL